MSDQRNKINCAKCHNAKCTLSGKEMHMAACTGYKRMTNGNKIRAMSDRELADYLWGVERCQDAPRFIDGWIDWLGREADT